jgi:hypothetical protein
VAANEEDQEASASAELMYEAALLESGFEPDNVRAFSSRLYGLLHTTLGAKGSLDDLQKEVRISNFGRRSPGN